MVEQHQYDLEVAQFDQLTRQRHLALWEHLLTALISEQPADYLNMLNKEGRLQARAYSRVETLVTQLCLIMNLVWDLVSKADVFQSEPAGLLEFTRQLNKLRGEAEAMIIAGFQDEQRLISLELDHESLATRRLRMEQTSLLALIKSLPAFRLTHYPSNRLIFQPGDNRSMLYFILSGQIRLYELLPDGRCVSLSMLGKNDVFSQSNSRETYFHDVYAETLGASTVASIEAGALERLMQDNPLLAERMVHSLSGQLFQSQSLIKGLVGRDVSVRLANTLLKLAQEFGVAEPEGQNCISIKLELTHQYLADMIASNRVTVTRKLAELQQKKLIKVVKGSFMVIDKPGLELLVA